MGLELSFRKAMNSFTKVESRKSQYQSLSDPNRSMAKPAFLNDRTRLSCKDI